MKTVSILIITILCLCLPSIVSAQVPQLINYQGRVTVGGTNFDGTGSFQFALVNTDGSATYWSNGVNTVSLTVTKGLYSVLLGDTTIPNMAAIPGTVFTNADVRLRVWFNGGAGLQQLSPDQRLAAVGYSLVAANVPDGTITSNKIAAGAVTASALAPGAVGSSQLASNLTISGTITASAFQGNGAGLTGISGAVSWQNVTGTSQQAQPNTGYLANNAASVTITLPASPNLGDIVRVSGVGAGGWTIAQNSGQSILSGGFINYAGLTNWTQTSAPITNWVSVASSADGTKLVAAQATGIGGGIIHLDRFRFFVDPDQRAHQ